MNVPDEVGVPLIVIVLLDQDAVTPEGKPTGVPIPVAPVVVNVILVNGVFIHNVGVDDAELTILLEITVIVPVAEILPHPPVSGIV